jgi:hypothetical protein
VGPLLVALGTVVGVLRCLDGGRQLTPADLTSGDQGARQPRYRDQSRPDHQECHVTAVSVARDWAPGQGKSS